jgi:oligopeptidase B
VSTDVLVLAESDERYEIEVHGSRAGDVIVLLSGSRDTTEVWLVDAHDPAKPARLVEPRRKGIEYFCEHARTLAGDRLFVVTNDGAVQYRLMVAPLPDESTAGPSSTRTPASGSTKRPRSRTSSSSPCAAVAF